MNAAGDLAQRSIDRPVKSSIFGTGAVVAAVLMAVLVTWSLVRVSNEAQSAKASLDTMILVLTDAAGSIATLADEQAVMNLIGVLDYYMMPVPILGLWTNPINPGFLYSTR